jgi:phenylacetate-coenzyme A ligase PaaK-like adenylate-forming protein
VAALEAFVAAPLSRLVGPRGDADAADGALALFRDVAANVPAYAAFLAEHGVDAGAVRTRADFGRVPPVTKESYVRRHPLRSRCRGGSLSSCDFVAVSSGSTGEPTLWPRSLADELPVASRFEQVFHDSFDADRRRTLAIVCFPLGTWVGGMFTTSCLRHLAAKGYPVTAVTPGNQKAEILRAFRALAPEFEQTVLLGYPPFLKDVIDAPGFDWKSHRVKLVMAGEVFSEEWRTLVAHRSGGDPDAICFDSVSLYGTADAGVLGNETPLSISIRRFLAEQPDAARHLFGESRLPTLVQYDPRVRFFEVHDGTLLFSGDNGVPLVRYHIADSGGLVGFAEMLAFLKEYGFDPLPALRAASDRGVRALPFAYVFGRADFTISYFGANVFPENVTVGLEQSPIDQWVTGKFVMQAREDDDRNQYLSIVVELAAGVLPSQDKVEVIADSILRHLLRLNSEFAHYVLPERQRPRVQLAALGDQAYFPVGVKHRYTRR